MFRLRVTKGNGIPVVVTNTRVGLQESGEVTPLVETGSVKAGRSGLPWRTGYVGQRRGRATTLTLSKSTVDGDSPSPRAVGPETRRPLSRSTTLTAERHRFPLERIAARRSCAGGQ